MSRFLCPSHPGHLKLCSLHRHPPPPRRPANTQPQKGPSCWSLQGRSWPCSCSLRTAQDLITRLITFPISDQGPPRLVYAFVDPLTHVLLGRGEHNRELRGPAEHALISSVPHVEQVFLPATCGWPAGSSQHRAGQSSRGRRALTASVTDTHCLYKKLTVLSQNATRYLLQNAGL